MLEMNNSEHDLIPGILLDVTVKHILTHIFAKFKYFTKQMINCSSSDHKLLGDIKGLIFYFTKMAF